MVLMVASVHSFHVDQHPPPSRFLWGSEFSSTSDDQVAETRSTSEGSSIVEDRYLRFGGVGRLYSTETIPSNDEPLHEEIIVERLTASTVAVVGLGGVGSWAAEALCRSGVGKLILIDLDDICISNTNRQLHAMSSTIGQMKIDEMKKRLQDINPHCQIELHYDFVSRANVGDMLDTLDLTACLDAIDGTKEKASLIAACAERQIPLITCGGAAGRMDPTKIVCDDLSLVTGDRLLSACRRDLRKNYGFHQGISQQQAKKKKAKPKKWNIDAIFSTEVAKALPKGGQSDTSSLRRCDGALGTACFVTGTFGFVAASRVVEMIANEAYKTYSR